jgi:MFS transporter, AAHS family, 4-hydroxybenzoate transporter
VTISDILDSRRIGTAQLIIVALCAAVLVLDGADLQLLAFVSPAMIAEWGVSKAMFGIALSAAVGSMAVGSLFGGLLGDRWGRKQVLMLSTLLFGAATIGTSLVENVTSLTILRLLSGLGFGAATPNALALSAEWLPLRARAKVAALMSIGAPFGGLLAGGLALLVLPSFGWRGCFVACGVLTLLVGALTLVMVPESGRFLLQRGRKDAAERAAARVLGAGAVPAEGLEEPAVPTVSVADEGKAESLWSPAFRRFTGGIWLCFFAASFITYAVASWLPVILISFGFTLSASVKALTAYNTITLISALLIERVVVRAGSLRTLIGLILFGMTVAATLLTIAFLSYSGGAKVSALVVMAISFGIAITQGAITSVLYAVVSFGYPVAIRAGGIGASLMAARLGGVVAIAGSGALLSLRKDDASPFFLTVLILFAICAAGALVIDRHLARRAPASDPNLPA